MSKSRLGKMVESRGGSADTDLSKPSCPWSGPGGDGPNGGVSQSMLGRFMVCPRRFGVRVYEGLVPREKFEPNIEYGNFWHAGEEAYKTDPDKPNKWLSAILAYYEMLCHKYPMDRQAITHWYGLCREQFPVYIDYWERHDEEKSRIRLFSELPFDVPYTLPSGRKVRLRGKWDGGSLVRTAGKFKTDKSVEGVWLDENKTKSQVDHVKITRQLKFDLQTMFYLIALREYKDYEPKGGFMLRDYKEYPIMGVRYNVVRRSAHKSSESMLKKMTEDIADDRGGEWFGRWNVAISPEELEVFRTTFLDPTLERLCLWWDLTSRPDDIVAVSGFTLRRIMSWTTPYGIYNPLDRGGEDAVDEYLRTGSRAGLQRVTNLFPELQSAV